MNNEDCLNIVEIADKRTLFVVCDGMGGHSCGEVASKTVCDSFSAYWLEHPDIIDSVQKIDDAAKAKIINVARKCNPDIKIYQMTIDPDAFRLKEELINS
jgi:protein phosphatase